MAFRKEHKILVKTRMPLYHEELLSQVTGNLAESYAENKQVNFRKGKTDGL